MGVSLAVSLLVGLSIGAAAWGQGGNSRPAPLGGVNYVEGRR